MRPSHICVAASLLIPLLACGEAGTVTNQDPPRAVAITLTPDSANLTFVGATQAFDAAVVDQYGASFPATVSWRGDAPDVFSVTTNGIVTAISNGAGTVTASFASLSAIASVQVRQLPATATLASGGQQEALPNSALPDPIVIEVKDRGGAAVGDVPVVFTPGDGHGSVEPAVSITDLSGQAAAVWKLGPEPGPQLLTASVENTINVRVTAASSYGAAIEIVSGDKQRALPHTLLRDPIVVRVLNSQGTPFPGTTVNFAPGATHGHVSHDSVATDQAGEAAVLWTLGDSAGPHKLTASLRVGPSTEITATALTGQGVCDRTPQVRDVLMSLTEQLDCAQVDLEDLGQITSIASSFIGLRRKGITSLYPDDFAGLVNLENLHLGNNELTQLPSGLFSDLGKLQVLNLCCNALASLPPDLFEGLTDLRQLALSDNQLSTLPPGIFSDLTSLESLDLWANPFQSLPPGALADVGRLHTLRLSATELRRDALGRLPHLRNLSLQVPTLSPNLLAALRRLRVLLLHVSQLPMRELEALQSLDTLHLSGYGRGEERDRYLTPVGTLPRLPALVVLDAWVTSAPTFLKAIGDGAPALVRARVRSPDFSGLTPGAFAGMRGLEWLYFGLEGADASMVLPNAVFAHLESLEGLSLGGSSQGSVHTSGVLHLDANTFLGLGNLERLSLHRLAAELPSGVFTPLRQLRTSLLWYGGRVNGGLPDGVFAGMSQLESLALIAVGLPSLPEGVFDGMHGLRRLVLHSNELTELRSDAFRGLSRLAGLDLFGNPLAGLPADVFAELTSLNRLELRYNIYSEPFPIHLQLVRTDTTDLGALGPATVVVRVREGAPLDISIDVGAAGASVSPPTVLIRRGAVESGPIVVSRSDGASGSVVVRLGEPPAVPMAPASYRRCSSGSDPSRQAPCYGGIFIDVGQSITLFR